MLPQSPLRKEPNTSKLQNIPAIEVKDKNISFTSTSVVEPLKTIEPIAMAGLMASNSVAKIPIKQKQTAEQVETTQKTCHIHRWQQKFMKDGSVLLCHECNHQPRGGRSPKLRKYKPKKTARVEESQKVEEKLPIPQMRSE